MPDSIFYAQIFRIGSLAREIPKLRIQGLTAIVHFFCMYIFGFSLFPLPFSPFIPNRPLLPLIYFPFTYLLPALTYPLVSGTSDLEPCPGSNMSWAVVLTGRTRISTDGSIVARMREFSMLL